jgi:DNA-binding MarR family transcriptional regulator
MSVDARYSVLFDLFLADSAAMSLLAPTMAPSGLTPEQYAEYSLLRTQGPMSVTRFADESHLPLSTASDTLRAMEQRGHVTRVRDPDDGRAWLLALTADGRAVHTRARRHFRSAAARVSAELGEREADVRGALALLADACVRAAGPDA